MKKWTESLIEAHRNPIVRLQTTGTKIYTPKGTEEESALISNNIKNLSDTVRFERVERRCARAKAVWLPELKLAQVTKATNIQSFTFQNGTGSYLHPEDALFLLETNRLEILWRNVPLSVQQGYSVLLDDDVSKYKFYKKLAMQGYKISSQRDLNWKDESGSPPTKKAKIDFVSDNHQELTNNETKLEKRKSKKDSPLVRNILERLLGTGPKIYDKKVSSHHQVYVSKFSSKTDPDKRINLHVVKDKELPPTLGMLEEDVPNLFGIVTPDSVAYYRFGAVNLPTLM